MNKIQIGKYITATLNSSSNYYKFIFEDDYYGESFTMDLDEQSLKNLTDFLVETMEKRNESFK